MEIIGYCDKQPFTEIIPQNGPKQTPYQGSYWKQFQALLSRKNILKTKKALFG